MLAAAGPRGEIDEISCTGTVLAGTRRLRIVDRDHAVQPWTSPDGRWLLCFNGEIFNYSELRAELSDLGRAFRSRSDTEVVLEAFGQWGTDAVRRFRGEFAFAIVDRAQCRTYLARDLLGVKPLYWSIRAGCLHVASEVKALVPVARPVSQVPPGQHGWAGQGQPPVLAPYDDLARLGAGSAPVTDPAQAAKLVRLAFEDSVRVRVDTDLTVGVILSGGLDSSLTLLQVAAMHPDCVAFTVGAPGSEDIGYARRLCAQLGIPHEVIEVAPRQIRLADIREAIRMCELTEYGDIINAVVSVPLFRRVSERGIKVVLTGDGSDELFGGYPMYQRTGPGQARRLFLHKLANLGRTELQRVDRASMGHGVEARVPFLDVRMVELAMRLPMDLKVRDGVEKWILREAFADALPGYICQRPKNPLSHSSGLHERARIYRPLFARLHRSFGYHLHEPVRRDFSSLLEACGGDLDLAKAAAPQDYRPREHARDFAGAARWNAAALIGSLVAAGRGGARHPSQARDARPASQAGGARPAS